MAKKNWDAEFAERMAGIQEDWLDLQRDRFGYEEDFTKHFSGSPVERLLHMALFVKLQGDSYIGEVHGLGFTRDAFRPDIDMILWTQAKLGKYTADFLLDVQVRPSARFFIVIEVDGHDFHERTKEQARHDKRRDRWMTEEGFTVLRFTGSEVWADPADCAEQVLKVARRKLGWGW